MDSNVFQEHNPWWRRPEFILEDSFVADLERQRYPFHHPLYSSLPVDKDGILTLRGPRRIGKTTLLKLLIKRLLMQEKVAKENVFFFPCDTIRDYKELEELLTSYLNYARPGSQGRVFIFLDEISFVKEWQRAVKFLADAGKLNNSLVLITGSNILDLKYSAERLPGRRGEIFPWDVTFLPLTFREFIALLKPQLLSDPLKVSLALLPHFRKLFLDYLICGGFPVTINEYITKGYLSSQTYEIFLAWIEGDLHRAGKSENFAYQIIRRLFAHLTSATSFYKLSRESGIASHTTVEEYLDIFEKTFIALRLPFFSLEQKQVLFRKNSKIYFADPFVLNCLKAKTEGFSQNAFSHTRDFVSSAANLPALMENAISAHLCRNFSPLYFGRAGNDREIDFVGFKEGRFSYFEVKYQKKVDAEEFSWSTKILGRDKLTVLCRNDYEEGKISLLPAEMFLAYYPGR
ncbi:MAG: ATP-binding protein [Armatimonadetes bacterium]|nr:ATP-binding protein [Armatimonadota bacterium]